MWLSNAHNANRKCAASADAGPVSIGGITPAVCTDGELRDAEILRPANILRLPKAEEQQAVLNLPDGKIIIIGVLSADIPEGIEAGEVYIKTDDAYIWLKNSGVEISGNVSVSGTLTVNGREVNGA